MRSKSNKRNSAEDKATIAASMAFGAIMSKIFGEVLDDLFNLDW